ncbi:Lysine exporter protein (LYSE/YGGA) [Stanieria cyanosphaera PCC 7437]|uniref:Lysine exporter protein (LYSE/YGGA) n=1 Tax=Stanieria cyanosphaera (strain ATCC 29371 / PCC 7437) TaxID=111780 RepID=K9XT96_STAC7|nr:LysE family translocator [Stanieria cyanosphaera]AFZ35301.1 Lysine exporter protein (LYSE/YGGA) [Stanieria cyanosphaera PCC 7437]
MQSSMTFSSIVALFGAMIVLASIPSVSVLAVSTRSATSGFIHGVFTTIGIVLGDIFFIIIAIWGLSFLAETMGSLFVFIKYLGGIYLIFLGIRLCRSKVKDFQTQEVVKSSLMSSFLTGLLITLGDQKATLFYLGFFPAFLDLSQVSYFDTGIIIGITIVAVGGVKLGYAFMADRARLLISSKTRKIMNLVAGSVMIAVGLFLITKP